MFKLIKLKSYKTLFFTVVTSLCFSSLFIFQSSISSGIKKGFLFCTNLLIPSLFLFMVFSETVLNITAKSKTSDLLSKITTKLFNLPGSCALAILIGLLGGYPSGAVNIKVLLEKNKITKKQAEYMCYFLVGAGPAFIVNVIGTSFFGNRRLGVLIFFAQFLASIILGIILAKFSLYKKEAHIEKKNNTKTVPQKNLIKIFINSVNKTSKNLFYMCSFVVLFSATLSVLQKILENNLIVGVLNMLKVSKDFVISIISLLFEVTNGCSLSAEQHLPIYFIIFAVSWAGISVHMQIFYILRGLDFSKLKFTFFRLIHGTIATVLFYVFLLLSNDTHQTIANVKVYNVYASSFKFAPASISLIIMCICFISEITERIYKFKTD